MTSAEFEELARPYYTKVPQTQGGPPPMIQWRHVRATHAPISATSTSANARALLARCPGRCPPRPSMIMARAPRC